MNQHFIQGHSDVAEQLIAAFSARPTPYIEEVFGLDIQVNKDVYPPEKREITVLYLESAGKDLLQNANVLDFGCGSGFLAIYAAKHGATVTAIDINQHAVACTIENVKRHGVGDRVTTLQSDGFANIPAGARFDVVMASIPWEAGSVDSVNGMEIAFYDPNFQTRLALFEHGYEFLNPQGCMLLSWSKRVERINPMSSFTDKFDFEIVHREPSTDGNEEEYLLKATKKR